MTERQIKQDFKFDDLIERITNQTPKTITSFVNTKCEELTKFIKDYENTLTLNIRNELMEAVRKQFFDDYSVKRVSTINISLAAKESLIIIDGKETKADPKTFCEYLITGGLYAMINYSRYGTDYVYMVCENGYMCNVKYGLPTKFDGYSYFANISLPYSIKVLIQSLSLNYEDVVKIHQLFKNSPELYNLNCEYYFELIGVDKKLKAENDRLKKFDEQLTLEKAKIDELRENFVMAEKRKLFMKEMADLQKLKDDLSKEQQKLKNERKNIEIEKQEIDKMKQQAESKEKKLSQRELEIDVERDSIVLLKDKYIQKLKEIQKQAIDEISLHDDSE
jgi:hypothetical protein